MSDVDALIVALADGRTMRDAALLAGMPSAAAIREAKAVGWPDLDAVRLAAAEIRERHAPPPNDLPGGDPVPPRKPEPIPVEPDVEAAMHRGAKATEQARAALYDRLKDDFNIADAELTEHAVMPAEPANDTIPVDLDAVVDRTDQREAQRGVWRPDDTPTADATDAAVEPVPGVDALLIEDTAATLQMLERITTPPPRQALGALTVEQRQRAVALRKAYDITCGSDPGPTVGDLLAMGDYIVTGTVPVLIVRGVAQPGERAS